MVSQLNAIEVQDHWTKETPIELRELFQSFSIVFEEPLRFPSKRTHDHVIELVPRSVPPNIRRYRYVLGWISFLSTMPESFVSRPSMKGKCPS